MTKEQLKRYRALKLELQDINAEIGDATVHDSVTGSKKDFPWTPGTRHVEGVPDEDYNLLVRKSNVESQIKEIEEFVNGIEDTQIQRIFRLRYMTGKKQLSWLSIAMKIGYTSEHTPKRKHDAFLKNI